MARIYIDTIGRALRMLKRVKRGSIRDISNLTSRRIKLSKCVMARIYIDTFGYAHWMLKRVQRGSIRDLCNRRYGHLT